MARHRKRGRELPSTLYRFSSVAGCFVKSAINRPVTLGERCGTVENCLAKDLSTPRTESLSFERKANAGLMASHCTAAGDAHMVTTTWNERHRIRVSLAKNRPPESVFRPVSSSSKFTFLNWVVCAWMPIYISSTQSRDAQSRSAILPIPWKRTVGHEDWLLWNKLSHSKGAIFIFDNR